MYKTKEDSTLTAKSAGGQLVLRDSFDGAKVLVKLLSPAGEMWLWFNKETLNRMINKFSTK